ncbi:MAG: hypothetical protein KBB55_02970 [Candidatus Buchananbacteria bacterium]|nr:hypothetical protein [Candidatus Buchananbacteria bacterium]
MCGFCGVAFSGVAKGILFNIEIDHEGEGRTHACSIQTTKNGEGQARDDKGQNGADVSVLIKVHGQPPSHAYLSNLDKGHGVHQFSILGRWASITYRYVGTDAEKRIVISGAQFVRSSADSFSTAFNRIVQWNQGIDFAPSLIVGFLTVIIASALIDWALLFIFGMTIVVVAALAAVVMFLASFRSAGASYNGHVLGQLMSSNNYRWLLLVLVTTVLLIEAAVFANVETSAMETATSATQRWLSQSAGIPISQALQAPQPLWPWWQSFGLSAVLTFGYFFIAFREEVTEAGRNWYNNYQRRRRNSSVKIKGDGEKGTGFGVITDFSSNFVNEGLWEIIRLAFKRFGR